MPGIKLCSGQGRGIQIHIYGFSYLKENKSNVYSIYIAMVEVILKMCSYNFSQCKAKSFIQKCEVEILLKWMKPAMQPETSNKSAI